MERESGTWLWTSLTVSAVIARELTIASTSINVCGDSLFKLLPGVFKSVVRIVLAVLIYRSQTPSMWLALGGFLIHISQSPTCVCRYCDNWLWYISWKAFQSSLMAPKKLVLLSDLIRRMLPRLPINLLNKGIKESVFNDCATSVWIAQLHMHVNITLYLFNSFL